jgi:peptidyl-prolyl cis-trans isomerase D
MLQNLRQKLQGWPSILVLGICVVAVSFFGIESYFMSSTDTYVAKVGKTEISQQDFQQRMNNLRQNMMAREGDKFDPAYLEQPAIKQELLNGMISQTLFRDAADKLGMVVSDAQVRASIATDPNFQQGGTFDLNSYRAFLASSNLTPARFEATQRDDLATKQLPNAITQSSILTDADMDRVLRLSAQTRDARYAILPSPAVAAADVGDADLDTFYKAHQQQFMTPEQVTLQYVEVNAADLPADATPNDADLQALYETQKNRYVQPEQREVSHILINVPKNATPEQQKAALDKAKAIAAQATPENFAKLAAQDSEDLGSKRQGGDLGWLEKGVANASFDTAMFAMKKGEISQPVLSPDEGYHVIWLRDVRSGTAKPFADVRADLLKQATLTDRDRKYNDIAGKLADQAYQNPSSLEPAAKAMNLPLKTSAPFGRNGGDGITANAKVIAAAFSDDQLVQGNSSSLIELDKGHGVVIHVDKHTAAAVRPLAEVRDDVRKAVVQDRIAAAAKKQADDLLARVQKGEDFATVVASAKGELKPLVALKRNQPDKPPALINEIFNLPRPAAGKSSVATMQVNAGSYALVSVDKVTEGDPSKLSKEERDAFRGQMGQAMAQAQTLDFIQMIRSKADVKVAADRL